MNFDQIRHAAATEPTNPDIRILRRVSPLSVFPCSSASGLQTRTVAVMDVETTGLDVHTDEVFDIAAAVVRVDTAGQITEIVGAMEGLCDPSKPIPPKICQLTGITDADVAGHHLNLGEIEAFISQADVFIAHNAAFDAPFIERLFPSLIGAAWACSARDCDWLGAGFDGMKLGHLLMQVGHFNTAHRAMADVVSLIHLLAHQLADGDTVIGRILERASKPTLRVEACGAQFHTRHQLKARGYRWHPGLRLWWTEIEADALDAEHIWLRENVMPAGAAPRVTPIDWHQRHR